ncbi:MAG: dTDP-4-amino-4,6-dideoxygalactose transaminase [Lachnospiraceae bacterium]|nr:dTDP-4-amino-4,6-dideoxygalactose transaminase [Lachnospiraceae bacterium]
MIPFNKAIYFPESITYMEEAIKSGKIAGNGKYTRLCSEWMENRFHAKKVLLTTSCSAALEMAAILLDIKEGDEVIMPSYTFVSTANAFVLRGAKAVFVDIRPDTMNMDERLIENAITDKTKAIVVVHYAGVSCEMDEIMRIAKTYNLPVVEDAAQGVMATYKGKALGTIGDLGCYSFHETKNYTMGEGGALVINDEKYIERAEIIREKGTNRAQFFRGEIDKYSWVDQGSSYLPSEINVAILHAQLERAEEINQNRLNTWRRYQDRFSTLPIELPRIPDGCTHNAHMFYIKCRDLQQRTEYISHMRTKGICCVFHYVPLHSAAAGKKFGTFCGEDTYTTKESERLVRLPLFYGLKEEDIERVVEETVQFFAKEG